VVVSFRSGMCSERTVRAASAKDVGTGVRRGTPVEPVLRRRRIIPAPDRLSHHLTDEERRLRVDDTFVSAE
jgi:hypothetical protein